MAVVVLVDAMSFRERLGKCHPPAPTGGLGATRSSMQTPQADRFRNSASRILPDEMILREAMTTSELPSSRRLACRGSSTSQWSVKMQVCLFAGSQPPIACCSQCMRDADVALNEIQDSHLPSRTRWIATRCVFPFHFGPLVAGTLEISIGEGLRSFDRGPLTQLTAAS